MKKNILIVLCLVFLLGNLGHAQTNCGNTAPEFSTGGNQGFVDVDQNILLPSMSDNGTLPTLEYAITIEGQAATDGFGDEILGFATTSSFVPADFGILPGQRICVKPVNYNLGSIQTMIDKILNGTYLFLECCSWVDLAVEDLCINLAAGGITAGSDIQDLGDVLDLLAIFSGDPNATVSVSGFVLEVETLNTDANQLPGPCGGTELPICYGVPSGLSTGQIVCYDVRSELNAKLFLEGAYDEGSGLMHDDLRANGLIPTMEPFSATGNYTFTNPDNIGQSLPNPFIVLATGPTAIVDWGFIEIRDKVAPFTLLASQPVLINRQGDLVDLDGVSVPKMDVLAGEYFVTIRHLNHLSATSSVAVELGTTVDFTTTAAYLDGTKLSTAGTYLLYAGDANGDGSVDASDRSDTWNDRNTNAYIISDCDLTGTVDASDRSIPWNNRNISAQNL